MIDDEIKEEQIQIFDTTLRDGMQTPGIGMDIGDRIELAKKIVDANVDILEIGMAANCVDYKMMPVIAQEILNYKRKTDWCNRTKENSAKLCGLSRCVKDDIKKTYEVLSCVPNYRKRIHLFIATSDMLLDHSLNKTKEQVIELVKSSVGYARELFKDEVEIQFSAEDAANTKNVDFLKKTYGAAVENGATILNIPDTTGWCSQTDYGNIVLEIKNKFPDGIIISTHTHNDSGLALALTLEGVKNGASQVEGCILGIGERAGNTDWMQIATNIHIKSCRKEKGFENKSTKANMELFTSIAEDCAHILSKNTVKTESYRPLCHPITGQNAYRTSSGIHTKAVASNDKTYYLFDPINVGAKPTFILGQTSGIHAVIEKIQKFGIDLYNHMTDENIKELTDEIKWHAVRYGCVRDCDIYAMARKYKSINLNPVRK
jgi:2-isopropylmalate synthase